MPKRLPRPAVLQRFGRLRVVIPEGRRKGYGAVLCICDCGKLTAPLKSNLIHGHTRSCGCIVRKHGLSTTAEYTTWSAMLKRCNDPRDKRFSDYGGRGVTVCQRWQGEHGFENFYADMGARPSKNHSLDKDIRVPGNRIYGPDTCKWATREEQANNKRNSRLLTLDGKTKTLIQWARELGISSSTLHTRIQRLGVETALRMKKGERPGKLVGERHAMARLTPDDVYQIREMAKDTPAKTIAEKFGIARCTVSAIKTRRLWNHLP